MLDLSECLIILAAIFLIYKYCDCSKLKAAIMPAERFSGPAWAEGNLVAYENGKVAPTAYPTTLSRRESLKSAADSASD